jgi:alpha/beta superfamily hydrolase
MTAESAVERLAILGPSGSLEAIAEDPGAAASRYAVVCHPHSLFGGTMDNKVVTTVARALRAAGMPTLRFNFRGVGRSEGIFDAGIGETADAAAVAACGAARWPGRSLVIAGFSFGAFVALRLAQQRPAEHLITIAPPLQRFDFSALQPPSCPWLVVQGDADEVVDPRSVIDWVAALQPRPQFLLMPGVGHFFHGNLHELRDAVIDAVRSG